MRKRYEVELKIYTLDTNILIYLTKNRPPSVAERMTALGSSAELCMEAERSTQKPVTLRRLNALTGVVPVRCAVTRSVCEHYAVQFTQLRSAGTPTGANGLWIACHALADDGTLVSSDQREFQRVAGLKLENWVED